MGRKAASGEKAVLQKQSKSGEVQRQNQDDLTKRLNEIEAKYHKMIKNAKALGHNVAADNLKKFLNGAGGTVKIQVEWLRSFSAVTNAEEVNQSRFESQLYNKALSMKSGESDRLNDYWESMLTGFIATELFYASGTLAIKSTGRFSLSKNDNVVTISGNVNPPLL